MRFAFDRSRAQKAENQTDPAGAPWAQPRIAYFSMEIALQPDMPTYSGGLGILAGDYLRAAADKGLPLVAITLLHRNGYFRQHLDASGRQSETEPVWSPEAFLELLPAQATIRLEESDVKLQAWQFMVEGVGGGQVPVLMLDTDVPQNSELHRSLTNQLYGGDERYRLCQEAVLGLGGVAMLRELGLDDLSVFHMNEGHSSLLGLALARESSAEEAQDAPPALPLEDPRCVFTTHTPVPAGHDRFPLQLVRRVLGNGAVEQLQALGCMLDGTLNMTYLGLMLSAYINGVSMRHEEVSREMFPNYLVHAITNGVHAATWTAQPFRDLYDRYLPHWQRDNFYLRYALGIPLDDIRLSHQTAKNQLLAEVARRTGRTLNRSVFTLGFARRATAYKRAGLLFSDLERLKSITASAGPLQIIFAGKAHPKDFGGKEQIARVFEAGRLLQGRIEVVYLEEYDFQLAQLMVSGVDLWLNTPQVPMEASGTSGMKAALNGVPSLSVLDGWWLEGWIEGVTGWAIGGAGQNETDPAAEARSLYNTLEQSILPLYYEKPQEYASVGRSAIALNGSFFNSERMVHQYFENAYR